MYGDISQVPNVECIYERDVWGTVSKIHYVYPELQGVAQRPLQQAPSTPPSAHEARGPALTQSFRTPGLTSILQGFNFLLSTVEAGMSDATPSEIRAWAVDAIAQPSGPLRGWDRDLVDNLMTTVIHRVVQASVSDGPGSRGSSSGSGANRNPVDAPVAKKQRCCFDDEDDLFNDAATGNEAEDMAFALALSESMSVDEHVASQQPSGTNPSTLPPLSKEESDALFGPSDDEDEMMGGCVPHQPPVCNVVTEQVASKAPPPIKPAPAARPTAKPPAFPVLTATPTEMDTDADVAREQANGEAPGPEAQVGGEEACYAYIALQ